MDAQYHVLPPTQRAVDLKANGEVSRMRSHKGNMPSLPQTKYCPLCPAKFTRTTHLNRHLRSHTNERLHRCTICQAEFTRSDLLTRHKRTCGDSSNANRSRRKSCQACAESKVKCNLQYPCSKCTARGRECVFINDPETSRIKKLASSKRKLSCSTASSTSESVASPSSAPIFPESVADSPTDFASTLSPLSPNTSANVVGAVIPMVPALSVSPGSASSQSSPRSDFYETQPNMSGPSSFDLTFDACSLDSYIHGNFATGEQYLDQTTLSPTCDSTQTTATIDFSFQEFYPSYGDPSTVLGDDQFMFIPSHSHGFDDPSTVSDYSSLASSMENGLSLVDTSPRTPSGMENLANSFYDPTSNVVHDHAQATNSADLELYLNLFFSAFCTQVPLVHLATWSMEDKPLLLARAMQACGALFVRTPTATDFIDEALSSTRDALILEFAKLSTDPREQNNLLLTVVLLQSIGLFHQKADQRISSNIYHGMLVTMIRRTGVIPRVNAWLPSDMNDAQSVDTAWREWANYEMIKRVLFLSYIHDCCHCMYFAISPSFQPTELDICLPCEDALWGARDSGEWYRALQTHSLYGVTAQRILGFPMQMALAVLGETRLSTVTLALNPFAHFILIHTILRNLYASYAENSGPTDSGVPQLDLHVMSTESGGGGNVFAVQYALHNWLQIWLGSPESMAAEESQEEPPFIRNALPFYWLAQVSLLALQDSSAVFEGQTPDARAESRFRLMKEWLDHIRAALRSGNPIPTQLWDELIKVRPQASVNVAQVGNDQPNGLLAFFPR